VLVEFDQQGLEAAARIVQLNSKLYIDKSGLTCEERGELNVLSDYLAYKIIATQKIKEAFE